MDLFLTPEGRIVFNEVNTIPGFTAHSRYPSMMRQIGLDFHEPDYPDRGDGGGVMRTLKLRREHTAMGPLILVNPTHPLRPQPGPELVPADPHRPGVLLERRCARLLRACVQAVGGGGGIVPVSGWRSQAEQQAIWDDTLEREGEDFTRKYVALPGCSEHQTGLAIDLGEAAGEIDFIRPRLPRGRGVRRLPPRRRRLRLHPALPAGEGGRHHHRRGALALPLCGGAPRRADGGKRPVPGGVPGLCGGAAPPVRPGRGRAATVSWLPCPAEGLELPEPEGCWQISGDNAGGSFLTVWEHLLMRAAGWSAQGGPGDGFPAWTVPAHCGGAGGVPSTPPP